MEEFWRYVRIVLFIVAIPLWLIAMAFAVILLTVVLYGKALVLAVWLPMRKIFRRPVAAESVIPDPHFHKSSLFRETRRHP